MTSRSFSSVSKGWAPALAGALVLAGGAAADPATRTADDGWEVVVTPYLWTTAIDGTVEADDASADVHVSFRDILEKLNLGGMGALEVRRGRFLATLDFFGAQLSDDFDAGPATRTVGPLSFQPAGGGPIVAVPATDVAVGPLDVEIDATTIVLDAKLGYRVLDVPWLRRLRGRAGDPDPDGDPRRFLLDLAIGARYWYMRTEVDVELGPIQVPGFTITPSLPAFPRLELPGVSVPGASFGGLDETFEESIDWVDLTLGGRLALDLTDRILLSLAGDVGGFDIGSSSHRTWMAIGVLGYRLGERWTLKMGYKALGAERGAVDVVIHGLVLGLSRRF